jgi:hypothetical protein
VQTVSERTTDGDPISFRPARRADIAQAQKLLAQAIDDSPYYSETFKTHEKARLGGALLQRLLFIDPWHVARGSRLRR